MAKKHVFWGMLAMALALSFVVVGCGDPLQEGGTVKLSYDKTPAVAKVTAVKTTGNVSGTGIKGVILTWDAVEEDVTVRYQVYVKQDGKKTIRALGDYDGDWDTGPNSFVTYDPANGAETANVNVDSWTALVPLYPNRFVSGNSYRFGVRTGADANDKSPSDIKWADEIIKID
jgi:hypothetical protein